VELAKRLARPSEYGEAGASAFTVVVPSLPGFPFTPEQPMLPGVPTHELWHELMTGLGFDRYLAHGGDLGAGISARLGQAHPEAVAGIHVLAVADPADLVQPPRAWAERNYNVVHYTQMPRGGHFAATEEPDLLAADIRAFAALT
jgi:pimeloyl-ACP methyl ester carboxylesterase